MIKLQCVVHQWICLDKLLQTNGKLFPKKKSNLFLNYWPKTEIFLNEKRGVNIDQIAMFYISMDLSREALQTNGKLFFQISESFSNVCLSVPREKKSPWLRQYQSYISNWYINGNVFTSTTP